MVTNKNPYNEEKKKEKKKRKKTHPHTPVMCTLLLSSLGSRNQDSLEARS